MMEELLCNEYWSWSSSSTSPLFSLEGEENQFLDTSAGWQKRELMTVIRGVPCATPELLWCAPPLSVVSGCSGSSEQVELNSGASSSSTHSMQRCSVQFSVQQSSSHSF